MANWAEKLNQMTHSAISKSKEVAEVTKLNVEIGTMNQNVKNIYTEVGRYVLENGLLAEDEKVAEWASKAAAIKADIEADTERIRNLKNVCVCPGCGMEVPKGSRFCAKCGAAIVVASTEPVQEEKEIIDADYSEAPDMAAAEDACCHEPAAAEGGCCQGPEVVESPDCGEHGTCQ